jgi:hypothetical protein
MDECVEFKERFKDFQVNDSNRGRSGTWVAAQFCALFAVILGGLAWFVNLFETFFCSFYCSFIIGSILLILAAGLQACTFLIFADTDFWYVPRACFDEYIDYTFLIPLVSIFLFVFQKFQCRIAARMLIGNWSLVFLGCHPGIFVVWINLVLLSPARSLYGQCLLQERRREGNARQKEKESG